jgi:RNA polymerase sigma-70 factor, ECF subfamily
MTSSTTPTSPFPDQPGLLRAFREGQRSALETVYRAYVVAIDRYLRTLARRTANLELGQTSAIADLLQEVFVRAFSPTGRNGYDGVRDYGPYLITIARNCFIDAARARGREVPTSPDALPITLEDETGSPDWYEPKTLDALAVYIRDLTPELKAVYEQRFVRGLSQEETSRQLGLSRRGIRTAEQRLRSGLRRALIRAGISLRELAEPAKDLATRIVSPAVKIGSQS